VDEDHIRKVVQEHWGLELGKCLKASQNHTYLATSSTADDSAAVTAPKQFAVRVTPDPSDARGASTDIELALLKYLDSHGLQVCAAIPSRITSNPRVRTDHGLSISVFPFAGGEPVVLTEWRWLSEESHVVALGRWLANLHRLTRQFAVEHPDLAAGARLWSQLHEGVLADAPIHPDDVAAVDDPRAFGLLHGDVNPSNYHWDAERSVPIVFDWDQMQRGWFLYDLAQPIWAVTMMAGAGSPVDRSAVPQADVTRYTEWLLKGYGEPVNRDALQRMIDLRQWLYDKFCRKALLELAPDSFMGQFCAYVVQWLESGKIPKAARPDA
jgi:Ser/Thr protein kinase RdoA (MazF antagonist)